MSHESTKSNEFKFVNRNISFSENLKKGPSSIFRSSLAGGGLQKTCSSKNNAIALQL